MQDTDDESDGNEGDEEVNILLRLAMTFLQKVSPFLKSLNWYFEAVSIKNVMWYVKYSSIQLSLLVSKEVENDHTFANYVPVMRLMVWFFCCIFLHSSWWIVFDGRG